jgi:hypothetical protein
MCETPYKKNNAIYQRKKPENYPQAPASKVLLAADEGYLN